ncbi:MAG: hypothetical protein PHZ07_05445 [Patescibacteria group bacterium]|nr:hypothetical protein [Patescibacteria group bacterium]MDD4304885.1 hypothetical protein [Patescibacteria group bacterium]MDD4695847.1 hypothetical protein [Patescibacteria group bacterium]
MLEQLFGSQTRTKLLRLFFIENNKSFFVREITRNINERINSVRRELENLEKLGLLKSETKDYKKYYSLNNNFILIDELRRLVLKSRVLLEKEYAKKFKDITGIKYLALTGTFVDLKLETITDILIVGKTSKEKIEKVINKLSEEFVSEINYTIMDIKEFEYRKKMADKFLYNVLKNKKIVLIDNLGLSKKSK